MQDLKIYKLETKENFIIYLRKLIISMYRQLNWHKRYIKEVDEYLSENMVKDNYKKKISPYIYIDFKHKILTPSNQLLNLVGDESNSGMSYKKFRKMVKKRQAKGLDLGLNELSEDLKQILNECNTNRNWSLHVPESLLTAETEYRENRKRETGGVDVFNPIKIAMFTYYEIEWVVSLVVSEKIAHERYKTILQQMKRDYSILIGDSVTIELINYDVRTLDDMQLSDMSMQIQKGKYKKIKPEKLD